LGLWHDFVTDGQKRDYLSRASQRARGATKNSNIWNETCSKYEQNNNCAISSTNNNMCIIRSKNMTSFSGVSSPFKSLDEFMCTEKLHWQIIHQLRSIKWRAKSESNWCLPLTQKFTHCTEQHNHTESVHLGLQQILLLFHLAYNFIAVATEVATSSSTVLLPGFQADPAEIILALSIQYLHTVNQLLHAKYAGIKFTKLCLKKRQWHCTL